MLLHYKDIKNKVVALMASKTEQMNYQRQIFTNLGKYEERNFAYISERPEMTVKALNRMVIGGQQNDMLHVPPSQLGIGFQSQSTHACCERC